MWPFTRKVEQKANPVGKIIAQYLTGRAVWSDRNYASFSREGYQRNVVAYRCISLVAKSAATVPMRAMIRREGDDIVAPERHPLNLLWNKPNPSGAAAAFREAIYSYYLISGNTYIAADQTVFTATPPKELWSLRSDRVSIEKGRFGTPGKYVYKVGQAAQDFQVDEVNGRSPVLHIKTFHPTDDWYGLSPMEAAAYAIDTHNSVAKWNKALLDNDCRPAGVLATENALSDEQFARLREEITEQFSGAKNAGRPLLLENGLEWSAMSLSPKDMDYRGSKDSVAVDICNAYGVPYILIVPGNSTYNNVVEAKTMLWQDTVKPLVGLFAEALSAWLAQWYGEDVYLAPDFNSVEALAPVKERQFKTFNDATFLTINEKRRALGYEDVPDGDVIPAAVPPAPAPQDAAAKAYADYLQQKVGMSPAEAQREAALVHGH